MTTPTTNPLATATRDLSAIAALNAHEKTCDRCGNGAYKLCPTGLPLVIAAAESGVPWLSRYKPAAK